MTLKNRGRSKKTEGRTRPKSKGGSLALGTYLKRVILIVIIHDNNIHGSFSILGINSQIKYVHGITYTDNSLLLLLYIKHHISF